METKINPENLKKLYTKATWPWIGDVIFDWAMIAASIALFCYYKNPITFLLALIIVGNRQHALVILGHEATHFTVLKNKFLNDLLSNIFNMWIVGISVEGYRILHFQHHKGLGTEADPEIHHKRSRSPQWDLPMAPSKVLKYIGMDLIGFAIPDYYIIVTYSKPPSWKGILSLILFHSLAIGILIGLNLIWPLIIFYAAIPTTFMLFFRLRLWIEHQGSERTNRLHLNWWQAFLLSPHNGWYHWEHHNWAAVPYHRLPELRKMLPTPEVMTLQQLFSHLRSARETKSGFPYKPA